MSSVLPSESSNATIPTGDGRRIWDEIRLGKPERRQELVAEYYMLHHRRRRYDFVVNEKPKVEFFEGALSRHLKKTKDQNPHPPRAIDLGCRGGALTSQFLKWADWLGVDVDPAALKQAAEKGINCTQMDLAGNLDFTSDTFDLVLMTEVLEHLPYPLITLTEIHRILRKSPTSMFIGSVPIDYHLRRRLAVVMGRRLEGDPTHIHSFSIQELGALLNHYFHNVTFHYVRTPHWPWNLLPPRLSVIDAFWAASHPREGVPMADIELRH